jgi:hypothetical protein
MTSRQLPENDPQAEQNYPALHSRQYIWRGPVKRVEMAAPPSLNRRRASPDLRPRMKLPMHAFEPRLLDVRVDLRGGDTGVTKQLLDLP